VPAQQRRRSDDAADAQRGGPQPANPQITARSAQSNRALGCRQRNTATSWRKTSHSTSLGRRPREQREPADKPDEDQVQQTHRQQERICWASGI
jgi:hypothetical protein